MGDRRPGFVPGRARGSGAVPALTRQVPADPNADLVGLAFPAAGGAITVTGSAPWNPAYVCVDTPEGPSVRVAAQVRRRKELA